MPTYRMTLLMGQGKTGWSESYYNTASSAASMAPKIAKFLDFRNTILSGIHEVDAVRLSIEGDNRRSRLMTPGHNELATNIFCKIPATGDYPEGSTPLKFDQVRACMQIGLMKDGVQIGLRYFDGIPDELTLTENMTLNFGNPPAWWNHWNNFRRIWIEDGWAIKMKDKTAGNAEKPAIRWELAAAAPNVLVAVVSNVNPLAVTVGDRVSVRGVRMKYSGVRSPNGEWVVDEVQDVPATLSQKIHLRNATAFDPADIKVLGFIRKNVYQYVVPDVIESIRAGIHKRGKRFGVPRGRVTRKVYMN